MNLENDNKDKNQEPEPYSVKEILIILAVFIAVNLVFDSTGLLKWAKRQSVGTTKREVAIAVTKPLADAQAAMNLDLPVNCFKNKFRSVSGIKIDEGFKEVNSDSLVQAEMKKSVAKQDATKTSNSDKPNTFSSKSKMQLLLIGDSMMGPGFGYMMLQRLATDSTITPDRYFKHSSGLSRPDYFNWFTQISSLYKDHNYNAVVVMMGTNDAQGFEHQGQVFAFGTDGWIKVYRERVNSMLDLLLTKVTKVFWVGMPPMREPGFDGRMRLLSKIVQEEVQKRKDCVFVSTIATLGDGNGAYAPYKMYNGTNTSVREGDGIHFSNAGGDLVAISVINAIKTNFIFH